MKNPVSRAETGLRFVSQIRLLERGRDKLDTVVSITRRSRFPAVALRVLARVREERLVEEECRLVVRRRGGEDGRAFASRCPREVPGGWCIRRAHECRIVSGRMPSGAWEGIAAIRGRAFRRQE